MTDKSKITLASLTILFLIIINFFLTLYTMSSLWSWFIVPLGFPAIGLIHAWGLHIIKNIMTFKGRDKTPSPKMETVEDAIEGVKDSLYATAAVSSALLVGYLIHLYM